MNTKLIIYIWIIFLFSIQNLCSQPNTYVAKGTTLPLFIDGDTSDLAWKNAKWHTLDQVWVPYSNIMPSQFFTEINTQTISGKNDLSIKYKTVWSPKTHLLYFLVDVTDDQFIDGYVFGSAGYSNFDILEIFLDENKSGGLYRFDTETENSENAFAYHILANKPEIGCVNKKITQIADFAGKSFDDYYINDYTHHVPEFALKKVRKNNYIYEFSLIVFNDKYTDSAYADCKTKLHIGKKMGFSVAYSDNDAPDKKRDHFIGSVTLAGNNNNDIWQNASLFGSLVLEAPLLSISGFKAKKITSSEIEFDLNIKTPNFDTKGFYLFQNDILVRKISKNTSFFSVKELNQNQTYNFYLVAFNDTQVSEPSERLTLKTLKSKKIKSIK